MAIVYFMVCPLQHTGVPNNWLWADLRPELVYNISKIWGWVVGLNSLENRCIETVGPAESSVE